MQKFGSIVLAMWVLLLSTHIPLHAHFCCDTLVDASLYAEAKACCDHQKTLEKNPVIGKKCCLDWELVFDGYDDCAHTSIADFDTPELFSTAFGFSYHAPAVVAEKTLFSGKDPPEPSHVSLYTLFEVYLI